MFKAVAFLFFAVLAVAFAKPALVNPVLSAYSSPVVSYAGTPVGYSAYSAYPSGYPSGYPSVVSPYSASYYGGVPAVYY